MSYRLIVQNGNNGDTLYDWVGPHSAAAMNLQGTSTSWGSTYYVSAFNVGDIPPTGATFPGSPYDTYNTRTSGWDYTDLTAQFAGFSNGWNNTAQIVANPIITLFPGNVTVTDAFSYNPTTKRIDDTLSSWGAVRNVEYSISAADAAKVNTLVVTNYQNANIQYNSNLRNTTAVRASAAQSGTFDFHNAVGVVNCIIGTCVNPTLDASRTYDVETAGMGGTVTVISGPNAGAPATDYAGAALSSMSDNSLLILHDLHGKTALNLNSSPTYINTELHLTGGSAGLTLLHDNFAAASVIAAGGDSIVLNGGARASGHSNIYMDDSNGMALISNFSFVRYDAHLHPVAGDTLDLKLPGGNYVSGDFGANAYVGDGEHGVIFAGMSSATLAAHETFTNLNGSMHLLIS